MTAMQKERADLILRLDCALQREAELNALVCTNNHWALSYFVLNSHRLFSSDFYDLMGGLDADLRMPVLQLDEVRRRCGELARERADLELRAKIDKEEKQRAAEQVLSE